MTTAWGLYGQSLYDLAVEEKAVNPRFRSRTVLSCWMRPSADRSILIC